MRILHILESKMIYIVFMLMGIAILTGFYYHGVYLGLKNTLPIALLLMLYQPMVYLDITKAFTKRTAVKTKYLVIITTYYLAIFPVITYLFFYSWRILFPSIDPRIVAGMVLISLAPIPSSAPAFTNIAGGAFQLALIGVVWTFLLSILAMPVYAKLLLHTVIVVPVGLMIKSLIIYIITPLLLGQATKYLVLKTKGEKLLIRLKNPLKIKNTITTGSLLDGYCSFRDKLYTNN
jgi:ACR3 family arsenite transporter